MSFSSDATVVMFHHGVASSAHRRKIIAGWLFTVAAMVFVMVVIGGLTRLTHSGLSMVEWKPLTGWWPPTSHADWRALFEDYRRFPEFQKINHAMDLSGFQSIFWLEFIHRVWGRLIGLVFFLPFIFFLARKWVDRALGWRLAGLFALGAAQGLMGWYMVKSGLIDRPDVSQYRLAAHLALALIIIAALIWTALGALFPRPERTPLRAGRGGFSPRKQRLAARALAGLIFLTALSGAFVAGLDAGFAYNTFPFMEGKFIPADVFAYTPAYLSVFEDITTVQFDHRILAESTFLLVLIFGFFARKAVLAPRARRAVTLFTGMVLVQAALGVSTLLLVVPTPLASLHQAGAVILFSLAIWVCHETRTVA
ncbi:COX15/CtaA family protein [Varunaivibrio sulfuroxidans]|uniref:Heme A synthase n=1 Tax=Varunaivibrio sulfuroxidans TaxID=1773489 RepID=A0A4R3J510_9PROT|nr:COX15/CtaA family protein [Varunaivibrio sulfuroxidans]TCS60314.1 cytochrome c oxidase assembly protein subunit 15 [Varunaivibrio sulfuroxidans]WES30999.1 COX15/CtaA family protein [Varunaivibrio sulfuroxidans]